VLPPELFQHWGKRDPIGLYEEHLQRAGVAAKELEAVETRVTAEVDKAGEEALASRESNMPPPPTAIEGVYA